MVNVKTGFGILALAAIAYVGLSKRGDITQFASSSFDSGIFEARAKSAAASARNQLIDSRTGQIQAEINKATAFIEQQREIMNPNIGKKPIGKLGFRAAPSYSVTQFLSGQRSLSSLSKSSQEVALALQREKQANKARHESISIAQDFIRRNQEQISLLDSQRL